MALLTIDECNQIISDLLSNPVSTVTLPGGRSYTYRNIDEVLKLRSILVEENKKLTGEISTNAIQKCYFDLE
jgi:hypothetical protein